MTATPPIVPSLGEWTAALDEIAVLRRLIRHEAWELAAHASYHRCPIAVHRLVGRAVPLMLAASGGHSMPLTLTTARGEAVDVPRGELEAAMVAAGVGKSLTRSKWLEGRNISNGGGDSSIEAISRALDEIDALRRLQAWAAVLMEVSITYASFPARRRKLAGEQITRMRQIPVAGIKTGGNWAGGLLCLAVAVVVLGFAWMDDVRNDYLYAPERPVKTVHETAQCQERLDSAIATCDSNRADALAKAKSDAAARAVQDKLTVLGFRDALLSGGPIGLSSDADDLQGYARRVAGGGVRSCNAEARSRPQHRCRRVWVANLKLGRP